VAVFIFGSVVVTVFFEVTVLARAGDFLGG
jgi:hypothetical protein